MKRKSMTASTTAAPLELPVDHHRRLVDAEALAVRAQPVPVGLGVDELERVGGQDARVEIARRLLVEQQADAGRSVDPEVEVALRADAVVLVEVLGVDDLLARLALDPEPLGHLTAGAGRRALGETFLAAKPGHRSREA